MRFGCLHTTWATDTGKKKLIDFANIQVTKKKKEVLKIASKRIVETSAEAVRLHHRETNWD